jgi:hypothetical protein
MIAIERVNSVDAMIEKMMILMDSPPFRGLDSTLLMRGIHTACRARRTISLEKAGLTRGTFREEFLKFIAARDEGIHPNITPNTTNATDSTPGIDYMPKKERERNTCVICYDLIPPAVKHSLQAPDIFIDRLEAPS